MCRLIKAKIIIIIVFLVCFSINIYSYGLELDFGSVTAKEEISLEKILLLDLKNDILEIWFEKELKNEKGELIPFKRFNFITENNKLSFVNEKVVIRCENLLKNEKNSILHIKVVIYPTDNPGLYETKIYFREGSETKAIPVTIKINPWVSIKNIGEPEIKHLAYSDNNLYSSGTNILEISSNTNWILYMRKEDGIPNLKVMFDISLESINYLQLVSHDYLKINNKSKVIMQGKKTTSYNKEYLKIPYKLIIDNYKEIPAGSFKTSVDIDLKVDNNL